METQFSRTRLLIGGSVDLLFNKTVAVFGVGGVGSYAVEALARAGVGNIVIIDNDTVNLTNINRQLIALHSTVGKFKTQVLKERILDINPNCKVQELRVFFDKESVKTFNFSHWDYIIDAIDTVASKILLIVTAKSLNIPIISCMGAGNKVKADFMVSTIEKTVNCPLAKIVRQKLKALNITNVKVVYSQAQPIKIKQLKDGENTVRQAPGSMPYIPPVAGFMCAGEVIRDLINYNG